MSLKPMPRLVDHVDDRGRERSLFVGASICGGVPELIVHSLPDFDAR
jgi:hypothetical protein